MPPKVRFQKAEIAAAALNVARKRGIDAVTAGSIIAMGGLLGMIAPPVNTAALIICAGIDVPYVGFTGPLALITFPLAILFVLLLEGAVSQMPRYLR